MESTESTIIPPLVGGGTQRWGSNCPLRPPHFFLMCPRANKVNLEIKIQSSVLICTAIFLPPTNSWKTAAFSSQLIE